MKKLFQYSCTGALMVAACGCGGEDTTPGGSTTGASPPPGPLYSITHAYDVANNNNASDLRVELSLTAGADTSQLTGVRLVIAKASTPFTEAQISGLSDDNSFLVPLSKETRQVIHPNTAKDADGDPIANGQGYNLHVAAAGKSDFRELSAAVALTLADEPIHAGSYLGTWEDLGPPGPGKFPVSMRLDQAYAAKMYYSKDYKPYGKGAQDVTATLTVDQAAFTFAAKQLIGNYVGGGQFGGGNGCPVSQSLTGKIVDEVTLVFDEFKWSDCDGSRSVRLKFTRQ